MKNIYLSLLFLFTTSLLSAQDFLTINPDVKTAGMGDVSVSMPASAFSFYNNAAAPLFTAGKVNFGMSYTPWLRDLTNGYSLYSFGGFLRLHSRHAITIGGRFYRNPRVKAVNNPGWGDYPFVPKDENNQPIEEETFSFRPKNAALAIGYGYRLTQKTGIALTMSYVRSEAGEIGKAQAVDFSLAFYSRLDVAICDSSTLLLGGQISNVGFTFGDYPYKQPQLLKAGGTLVLPFTPLHHFLCSIDLGYQYAPSDTKTFGTHLGAEYSYHGWLALRCGYHIADDQGYNFGTVGAGLNYWHLQAGFSYLMASSECPWRNTYRLGLSLNF